VPTESSSLTRTIAVAEVAGPLLLADLPPVSAASSPAQLPVQVSAPASGAMPVVETAYDASQQPANGSQAVAQAQAPAAPPPTDAPGFWTRFGKRNQQLHGSLRRGGDDQRPGQRRSQPGRGAVHQLMAPFVAELLGQLQRGANTA